MPFLPAQHLKFVDVPNKSLKRLLVIFNNVPDFKDFEFREVESITTENSQGVAFGYSINDKNYYYLSAEFTLFKYEFEGDPFYPKSRKQIIQKSKLKFLKCKIKTLKLCRL